MVFQCIDICYENLSKSDLNLLPFFTVFCPSPPSSIVVLLSLMTAYSKSVVVLLYVSDILCVNVTCFAAPVQGTYLYF